MADTSIIASLSLIYITIKKVFRKKVEKAKEKKRVRGGKNERFEENGERNFILISSEFKTALF